MKATTPGIAVLLTCVVGASPVAAQGPQDGFTRVFELRQENNNTNSNKAQTQAEAQRRAKAEAAQRRGGPRGQRGGQGETTETLTRIVRLVPGGTFDLRNPVGDITITGGGSEARIEAIKRVRNMPDGRMRALLEATRIDIAERGGNVQVRTVHPPVRGVATVDYIITLPQNANIILRTTSGNVSVQNISGDELTADTLSGNFTVRDLRSRMLQVHTVTGNMLLHDIATQRAILDSVAGNLEFAGRLLRNGQYELQTHSGDIRVTPSGNPGFDLEAKTYRGDLRSDFVLRLLQQHPPAGARGPRLQKFLRGTVGDAGATLTTSSFSGNTEILKPGAP
jgi:hypothetical protein